MATIIGLSGGMLGVERAPAGEAAGGSWLPIASMVTARKEHVVVALPGGRVLTVGGVSSLASASSAERYEPDHGWISAGSPVAKIVESATVLSGLNCGTNCGKVLVTDRTEAILGNPQFNFELYTPPPPGEISTGTWAAATAPTVARIKSSATLLANGKVLLAGGSVEVSAGVAGGYVRSAAADLYDPAGGPGGSWASTGSMTQARSGHTATRLANGKVLVVGGSTQTGSQTDSSELYNPATGQWQSTGTLHQVRTNFTLTALGDGRALVAGGQGSSGPLASAEVFDPTTGQWSETDPLVVARYRHSAVALPDGRAMVIGGLEHTRTPRASAEIFDPASSTWSSAGGAMVDPRHSHSASVFDDGRVLVAGGDTFSSQSTITAKAEIFDLSPPVPPPPTLSPLGALTGSPGRVVTLYGSNFTAVRQVSFAGVATLRFSVNSPTEITAVIPPGAEGPSEVAVTTAGGTTSAGSSAMVVVMPAGTWTTPGTMTVDRRFLSTTVLNNGKVLIAGGCAYKGCESDEREAAELFDPSTGHTTPTGNLLNARQGHAATLLDNGMVLVYGTRSIGGLPLFPAELYDPGTERWTPAAKPATEHPTPTATRLAIGKILVVGGATAELYDPAVGTGGSWTPAGTLRVARQYHTATLLRDGRVLVAGGYDGTNALGSAEIYDPAANSWSLTTAPLISPRGYHTATLLGDGTVLVVGGQSDADPLASAELFDPTTGTWAATGALHRPVVGHTATSLPDGTVLMVNDVAELYDPATRTWSLAGEPLQSRSDHSATLIPDGPASACGIHCGQVVVAGGYDDAALSIEAFTPRPRIAALSPPTGPAGAATAVTITGTGLAGVTSVRFGDAEATSVTSDPEHPDTKLVAVAPPHAPGVVDVRAGGEAGASFPSTLSRFSYTVAGIPSQVGDLVAKATSNSDIELAFSAADTGGFPAPAGSYVIKQSSAPIDTDAAFDAALSLCEGPCSVSPAPAAVGAPVVFGVSGLASGTTYHYAIAAVDASGKLGPRSNPASATTLGQAPVVPPPVTGGCPALPAPGTNQIAYPGGYSLIGLPAGTVVGSNSPLYGWFDQGGRGAYSTQAGNDGVATGRGYWAWFSCGRLVDLAGPGATSTTTQLGAYHASMVGNPSGTSPASVSGHDFAARWDPAANAGAGGYAMSGYRATQSLAVGQGSWVFAYTPTQITIAAQG